MRYPILFLILCGSIFAANHCVLSTATGTAVTWTDSTSTLSGTGVFTNVVVGQYIQVISGTNMVPRFWIVSSRTDNSAVISGGAGSANTTAYIAMGTSWTDAFTNLPVYNFYSYMIRGDTYYIGDGEYGGLAWGINFATAESGTTVITIKKAIESDHGSATGWTSAMGDGQAVWTQSDAAYPAVWGFPNDYYVIDGQTGGGPGAWTTGHGFKILMVDTSYPVGGSRYAVSMGTTGFGFTTVGDHITLSHVEIQGPGIGYTGSTCSHRMLHSNSTGVITDFNGPDSLTVDHCYFHDITGMPFTMVYPSNLTWEYNAIVNQESGTGDGVHATCMQFHGSRENIDIRYNLFKNCGGTAVVDLKRNFDVYDTGTVSFYGNVVYQTDAWYTDNPTWHLGFGLGIVCIATSTPTGGYSDNPLNACYFYNNTMVNLKSDATNGAGLYLGHVHTCVAANNLWLNCTRNPGNATDVGFFYHDHVYSVEKNTVINTVNSTDAKFVIATGYISDIGTNTFYLVEDPFEGYTTLDFRLKAAFASSYAAGQTLASPYDTDWTGITRGVVKWDRGALEFSDLAPVLAAIGPNSVEAGSALAFTATASNTTGTKTYTLDVAAIALGASIGSTTGIFGWTPTVSPSQVGNHFITVTVTDVGGSGLTDSETITVTVSSPFANGPPVITYDIPSAVIFESGATGYINGIAVDPDADTITYTLSNNPAFMTISSSTGLITLTNPVPGLYCGIVLTATSTGGTDTDTFTLEVSTFIGGVPVYYFGPVRSN
jgi:hypothetical protein